MSLEIVNKLIAEAAEAGLLDPSRVVAQIIEQLGANDRRNAFPQLLREHVVKWFSQQRMQVVEGATQVDVGTQVGGGRPSRTPTLGVRVARVRTSWAEVLKQQVTISNGRKPRYITFADATAADLWWLAEDRGKRAQRLRANEERYARWAMALEESGKQRLGELEEEPV